MCHCLKCISDICIRNVLGLWLKTNKIKLTAGFNVWLCFIHVLLSLHLSRPTRERKNVNKYKELITAPHVHVILTSPCRYLHFPSLKNNNNHRFPMRQKTR